MPGDAPGAAAVLEIRPAEGADIDRMLEAWMALTRYHASFERRYELRPGAESDVRALLRAQLRDADAAAWLALRGPQLAGYCAVRVDRAPPIYRERLRAEITDLWVQESCRRQGAARRLASRAFEWVRERGAERVEVRVSAANTAGHAFWAALDFGDFMDVLHLAL